MELSESSFCCGLMELGEFPEGNTEDDFISFGTGNQLNINKYDLMNEYDKEEYDEVMDNYYSFIDDLIAEFISNPTMFCTVSMQTQAWMYELLKAIGFEEVKRWKSNHGNYDLVMFIN